MKEDRQGPQGDADFAEKIRAQLYRGVYVARGLITRLRGLIQGDEAAGDAPREEPPPAPAGGVAPRRGDNAWMPTDHPHNHPNTPPPEPAAPKFRDEEGDESELPTEFATSTMGHILLAQGRKDEAREVFRGVLARTPDDVEARRGLESLGESPARHDGAEPSDLLDRAPPPDGYGVTEVRAIPVDPGTVVAYWEVAEAQRPANARYALCVVSMWTGAHGVERAERHVDGVSPIGDWYITGLPAGATHHVAVGYWRDQVFVPLVHATPVATPRGRPSAVAARVQATVMLPATATGPRIVAVAGPPDALAELRETFGLEGFAPTTPAAVSAAPTTPEVFERFLRQWQTAAGAPSSEEMPLRDVTTRVTSAPGAAGGEVFDRVRGQWESTYAPSSGALAGKPSS